LSSAALLLVLVGTLAGSLGLTRLVLTVLRRRAILDEPNERSSHKTPVPRGGGLAVITVVVVAWTIIGIGPESALRYSAILAVALALAAISWLDDLRGLGVRIRLGAQVAAVAVGCALWPELVSPFTEIGLGPLSVLVAAVAWIWFINLYNFMDGIDGISGVETASIGLGVVVLAGLGAISGLDGLRGAALAGAALGFLVWNWHPARVFLGDVGSIPLGFLIGWLLLHMTVQGAWAAALILPLYYLADATVTLALRAVRGRRIWEAHREHFYQRALPEGGGRGLLVCGFVALNVVRIGLAAVAFGN